MLELKKNFFIRSREIWQWDINALTKLFEQEDFFLLYKKEW